MAKPSNISHIWALLKETYADWSRHNAPKLGAALAYYTVLSIAPLLVVVVAVIGLGFGQQAARGDILKQIEGLVGHEGAQAIQTVVAHAYQPKSGILASLLGIITLFLGASGVFVELRDSLNIVWEVDRKPDAGIWAIVRDRFLSFGMVLAVGFLMLVSLIVSAAISAASAYLGNLLPVPGWSLQVANMLFSLVVATAVFAMIYRFLPDTAIAWHDTLLGALFTSVLFTLGKHLIGLYLGQATIASAYGAAGSLVVVLVWVYYSAQIFFFGAEFTHVYARRDGSYASTEPARDSENPAPVK